MSQSQQPILAAWRERERSKSVVVGDVVGVTDKLLSLLVFPSRTTREIHTDII